MRCQSVPVDNDGDGGNDADNGNCDDDDESRAALDNGGS